MHKTFLATAALLGATGVMLGAFGAHGLQRICNDEKILHGFQTGVQYQLWHAIVILAMAFNAGTRENRWIRSAFHCFWSGILLFSGSLYLLTYLKIIQSGLVSAIGPVTPLGGLLMIAGWILLLRAALEKRS